VFNLQREILKDIRVRKAIGLAYNFEWTNESLQYGLFSQRSSFVEGTALQAMDAPTGDELALLKSLGDVVPEDLYTMPAFVPHSSSKERLADRRNLRAASKLLEEAGWTVVDGKRQKDGVPLTLEFIASSSSPATLFSIFESFGQNLEGLGIDFNLQKIDSAQFTLRRREKEYDLIYSNYVSFLSTGTGLMQRFGSEQAEVSVFNPASLASPLVDAVIDKSLLSTSKAEEEASLMALDRALRYEYFMVPMHFNDVNFLAYFDQYEHPENMPPFAVGMLDFWWYNAEKGQKIRAAGALN